MPIKSDYISGTLTITQGATAFTGTGTGWRSAEFKEGDTLIDITGATEYMGVIEAITGEASGILTKAWEGPSLVNVPYRMRYQPDGARSTAQARNLIEILGNGNITAFALLNGAANLIPMFTGPGAMTLVTRQALISGAAYNVQVNTLADRAAYDGQDAGYAVLVSNIGDGRSAIYSKNSATSGDWSDPAYVTGAVGPVVQIEAGTTTTLPMGQDATVEVRPITDGYALDFGIPRGEKGDDGADGAIGATGPRGEGLQIGATGPLSERSNYDNEAEGFSFVDVEDGNLYFRMTNTPGVWSDPIPFGKGEKGDPGDSGATIVTTNGTGNGTGGPYTLTEAPASIAATWATISGVTQYNFTLNGNQITFGTPVPNGVAWQVKSSGVLSVVVPADGSVGASEINTAEAAGIRTAINAAAKPATATAGNLAVFDANREVQDTGVSKSTAAQAQAGTNDTAYMTPLKTAQAILSLSPPTDTSGLYSSVSALALSLADLQGYRLLMNGGVADAFDDESGISTTITAVVAPATGTVIGNMTYQGRLSTAFDGVTAQTNTQCAAIVGTGAGAAGKSFSTAKRIHSVTTYGCTDYGYDSTNQTATITIQIRAKNGTAPTNYATEGTVLGSTTLTGTWAPNQRTIESSDKTTAWDHFWVYISSTNSTGNIFLAEAIPTEVISEGLSINQIYDAALDLYRPNYIVNSGTQIPQNSGTIISNMTEVGGTANTAFDGIINQARTQSAGVSETGVNAYRYTGKTFSSALSRADVSGPNDTGYAFSGSPIVTLRLYGKQGAAPANAVDGTLLGSISFTDLTNESALRSIPSSDQITIWDHIWVSVGANANPTALYISEIMFFGPDQLANMTLISIPYPATTAPTQGRLVVQIDSPLTLTANTDFDGAISRDGGTTWVNMPLTLTGTLGTVKTYETLTLTNFTGASGSSLLFRIRTLTNKNIPVSGVVMQWK